MIAGALHPTDSCRYSYALHATNFAQGVNLPALLKGFLDRIFLPGFAFKYRANSVLWDRLLTGRTAELLVTMDSPPWYYRWVQRQPGHRQMKQAILEFSGIRPVRVHSFGPVVNSSDAARAGWIRRACKLGARAGA